MFEHVPTILAVIAGGLAILDIIKPAPTRPLLQVAVLLLAIAVLIGTAG